MSTPICKVWDAEQGKYVGIPAIKGTDGHTPVKGTDYWTASDKAEVVAEAAAAIDLTSYAKKNEVPVKTSQLTNDSGFLTSHQDISGKQDKSTLEADVAAKGFTKNTGTYSKPAGGIPKSDLAPAVQTSLGKADTALQEHQSLAAYRTAAAQDVIDSGKVDKVTGKGLSSNDYTAAAKAKVDAIPANPKYTDTVYDDTALKERVATIEGKESVWDAKSDFSGSYNDLTDKPTIPTEVTPLIGTTNNLTPTQVHQAILAGTPVMVKYTDNTYGELSFTNFNVADTFMIMVSQTIVDYDYGYVLAELSGVIPTGSWVFSSTVLAEKTDIPSKLPNPNALTFTGAVTGSYDGSAPMSVKMPDLTDTEIITAPTYTNKIPISTDTAGSVYNGVGYKSGYYLESNGSEVAGGNTLVTGFIPVKKGDIIRIKDASIDETLMIALYPSSKATSNNIGKTIANIKSGTAYGSITTSGGEIVWDTSTIGYYFWNDFAYMRATILSSNAIITVNEQIINTMTESKILKPDIKVKKGNLAFPVMSPMLSGKNVVFFGDSIFGMTRDSTSVAAYASQFTGATISNVGFGGCRMAVHPTSGYAAFSMWKLADAVSNGTFTEQNNQAASGEDYFSEQLAILKSIDFSKVDMIVIHYGTNDFTGNVTINNADDDDDTATLCGALRYSIRKIQTAYPKIRIFVSLPIYRKWNGTGAETYTNSSGNKLWDFCTALAGVAGEFNCPIINGYKALGINSINNSAFSADGTHLNDHGRKVFGEYIGGCLIAPSGSAS